MPLFSLGVLPDIGVDIGALIAEGVVYMGAIVGVAVGAFIAFTAIKKGLKWVSKAFA